MIRVTVHSPVHVTVTRQPLFLSRWLLGQEEYVRDALFVALPSAWRRGDDQLAAPVRGGLWLYEDNREVEPAVLRAIGRALEDP